MEIEENDEIPEKIMKMSKEMGLFGLSIPEEYGGPGIGMVGKCAILEELGRHIMAIRPSSVHIQGSVQLESLNGK